MLFSELLEQLTYGELSNLALSNNGAEIEPCNYARIAALANTGLTDLYTRFAVKEDEAIIQQYDAISTYYLREKYSLFSGSAEPTKYLVDTAEAVFQANVIHILALYNEVGEELVLNDENDDASVFTPNFDAIQIVTPNSANAFAVIYQAKHDRLLVNATTDPTTVDLDIPGTLILPLTTFVASRVISAMGTEGVQEGNNLLIKYEQMLRQLEQLGVFNKDQQTVDQMDNNGWV